MAKLDKKRNTINIVFADFLNKGKEVDVPVFGLSMFPFFLPADIVRVRRVNINDLSKGDVVVFRAAEKLVAHRLLKIDFKNYYLVCKGDGLIKNDRNVLFDDFLGVVIVHYRNNRKIRSFKFVRKLVVILSPFTGVVFYPLGIIWNKLSNR